MITVVLSLVTGLTILLCVPTGALEHDLWGRAIFQTLLWPAFALIHLIVCIIPSAMLLRRTRNPYIRASLLISALTVGLLVLSWFSI